MMAEQGSSLVVFKGGTAFNGLLSEFKKKIPSVTYILPITDDGGSSREIGRVFGGPSIGDLRATLTRLSDESTPEARGVKKILEHRLPNDLEAAAYEWQAFLEDRHSFYIHITPKYRNLIRCFLDKFEEERLERIDCKFDMRKGSIGNFFFSGARMALGSLQTAIFMYSNLARIPETTRVLPIIDSNESLAIAVKLANHETVIGQHMISHPSDRGDIDKSSYVPMPAVITQLFYVDKIKNQTSPYPHHEVLSQIENSRAAIYGMGSLWTSIIPSLVLRGIGETVAALKRPKIAILNCCHDRETAGMTGLDFVQQISCGLNRYGELAHPPCAYITYLFAVEGTAIPVDEEKINQLGIRVLWLPADSSNYFVMKNQSYPVYASSQLINVINKLI